SIEWDWVVPSQSTLGEHAVRVSLPGVDAAEDVANSPQRRAQADWLKQVHGSFLVAAYRRPDFRVNTVLGSDLPVAGARLAGRVDAAYVFGASIGARPVRWSITRQPDMSIPAPILERFPAERYAFGYYPGTRIGAERIAGGDSTLDES